MSEFLLGLYIVAVGLTGNAGNLLYLLAGEAGFIPWIAAIGIGYYAWNNVGGAEREPVRGLILASIAAIAIKERSKLVSSVSTAWSELNALGSGSGQSNLAAAGAGSGGGGFLGLGGSAAAANPAAFLQSIYPAAKQTAATYGLPVAAVLGQSALETGWGTSPAFLQNNNVAGINIPGGNGSQYASYSSPAASFNALGSLIANNYPGAIGSNVTGYANALQSGGYATDPAYASKLIATANSPAITTFLANQGNIGYNGL